MASTVTQKAPPWDSQPLEAWAGQYATGNLISIDGKQTHYVVKGSGKPVILIHGAFFDGTVWCHNLDALAQSCRVYVLDLWGFGYSARISQPSYELYSDQLAAFMQALNIEKATLIGQSLGGGVAIQFSVQFPDKVDKLVLVDSAGLPNPDPFSARIFKLKGVGEYLMAFPGNTIRQKMLKNFFLFKPETIPPALFRRLTWFQRIAGTSVAALALMRLGFADKLEAALLRLAALDLPVMVVWGAQDRAIPLALGQRIHQMLPHSKFLIIPAAGHVPNLEQPALFNSQVTAFLSE
ncbi:MAG: alpha/beta hydrolase [Thiobacillus sp.]|nr:alpha/beta hydrolase [Thiobacillus sp.]